MFDQDWDKTVDLAESIVKLRFDCDIAQKTTDWYDKMPIYLNLDQVNWWYAKISKDTKDSKIDNGWIY
jgi:hypothetical protein